MEKELIRPAWVEIDLNNLEYNINRIKKKIGNAKLIGVVKADSYGHGALEVSKVLIKNGCEIFAVATLEEGITLREAGNDKKIIVLGLCPKKTMHIALEYDLILPIAAYEDAEYFDKLAKVFNKKARVIIALDTGMGRIGYQTNNEEARNFAAEEIKKISLLKNICLEGIFSHFSMADSADIEYVKLQESRFKDTKEKIEKSGVKLPIATIGNSATIMEFGDYIYDAVRPGIILYGLYPSDYVPREHLSLKPVMSVKAEVVYVKDVPANTSVGYGRKYTSHGPARIATLGLGYADGYPRSYSPNAKVIIDGKVCKIAGNICMDQCMVDVTEVPNVKVGDIATILGKDGEQEITADYIAQCTGTINYEVVCGFGQRLPKIYKK